MNVCDCAFLHHLSTLTLAFSFCKKNQLLYIWDEGMHFLISTCKRAFAKVIALFIPSQPGLTTKFTCSVKFISIKHKANMTFGYKWPHQIFLFYNKLYRLKGVENNNLQTNPLITIDNFLCRQNIYDKICVERNCE